MSTEKIKFPNFFIVGAQKAGTTSIYRYLKQNSNIYLSPIKEPNFFSSDIDITNFRNDYKYSLPINLIKYLDGPLDREIHIAHINEWEQYLKLFKNIKNETAIGECSTSYLYSKVAAKNIKENISNARIIIILRNPIERAFSHYLMALRDGHTEMPFIEAIKSDFSADKKGWGVSHLYIELGLYYEQVRRYIESFSPEQLKIYFFEDLKENPKKMIQDIFNFLEVSCFNGIDFSKSYNKGQIPRFINLSYFLTQTYMKGLAISVVSPKLKKMIKKILFKGKKENFKLSFEEFLFLKNIFQKDIENLSSLIKKDLSHWVKK